MLGDRVLVPRFLLVSLVLVSPALSGGCTKKGAGTRGAGEALAKVPPVPAAPLQIPKANMHGEELGHFVIDDLGTFAQHAQKAATLPGGKPPFDVTGLRKMFGRLAPDPAIGDRIAFDRPMGCVVYDPIQYMNNQGWPGVCFFSYEGGAEAFAKDLEAKADTKADANERGSHLFAGQFKNRNFFVDKLGELVVLSGHDTRFAASREYIQKNIVGRTASDSGVTFDLYVADLNARYGPLLRPLLENAIKEKGASLALATAADPKSTKKTMEDLFSLLEEIEQLRMGLESDEHRLTVSFGVTLKEEAPFFQRAVGQAYKKTLDSDLLARMPRDLIMLAATVIGHPYSKENPEPEHKITERWGPLAKILGKGDPWIKEMHAYEESLYRNLGDQVATGIFPNDQGPGAMVVLAQTANGVSVQDKWRKELSQWSTDAWTPKMREAISFSFTPKATRVNGVMLDEIKIAATDKLVAETRKSLGQDKYDALMNLLGSMSVVIHLGQVEHIAFGVITTHDAAQSSSKVIAALRGVDNFVSDQEFAATAARFSGNSFAAVVDSGPLSRLLLSSRKGEGKEELTARNGLQDSQFITRIDPKVGTALRWSISTPLVPLMREVAERNSKEKTMAR